ncbi:hypothetical protein QQ054_32055 [Oscillatoria amoena NRMC-F 0135]|nr:hypothetical protein [Oscillatoria amoena NRMC-F 0135]
MVRPKQKQQNSPIQKRNMERIDLAKKVFGGDDEHWQFFPLEDCNGFEIEISSHLEYEDIIRLHTFLIIGMYRNSQIYEGEGKIVVQVC